MAKELPPFRPQERHARKGRQARVSARADQIGALDAFGLEFLEIAGDGRLVDAEEKAPEAFDGLRGRRPSSADWETMAAPADSGPEQSLEITERSRILREAIAGLPENQKVAITLSRYEGLENEKIAEILGSTVSAIEALLHRAKRNQRKKLWRYYKNVIDGESYDEAQD